MPTHNPDAIRNAENIQLNQMRVLAKSLAEKLEKLDTHRGLSSALRAFQDECFDAIAAHKSLNVAALLDGKEEFS